MDRLKNKFVVGAVVVVVAAFGGVAVARGVSDQQVSITGPALEQASRAALDHTGEGKVTETEVGDEDGYYEVEVTLDSGDQVDVHLDKDFNVLGSVADDESQDETADDGNSR